MLYLLGDVFFIMLDFLVCYIFFTKGVGNNYKVFDFKFNKNFKRLHPIFLTTLSFAWSVYKINQKKDN